MNGFDTLYGPDGEKEARKVADENCWVVYVIKRGGKTVHFYTGPGLPPHTAVQSGDEIIVRQKGDSVDGLDDAQLEMKLKDMQIKLQGGSISFCPPPDGHRLNTIRRNNPRGYKRLVRYLELQAIQNIRKGK